MIIFQQIQNFGEIINIRISGTPVSTSNFDQNTAIYLDNGEIMTKMLLPFL